MSYVVTAPYVTLKVRDAQSGKFFMMGFYAGAPVPFDVDEDSLRSHVEGGMVAEVAGPAEPEPEAKPVKATAKPAAK